jgi:S-(hydroxymethyl)glutathione dehydrogenase / alcohol dehydrogenase
MKTQAAVLHMLHTPLIIEEVEIPPLSRGQVLIKILFSGVCRTQLNEVNGWKGPDAFLPHLIGHEASGMVLETGQGVTKVKKNDFVVVSWISGSGLDGGPVQYKAGKSIVRSGPVATWSRIAVISENRLTKIPKNVPPDIAAIIGCAVATGAGIVKNTLNIDSHSTGAIFGVGGIGASAVLEASARKCRKIIAIDITQEKLDFAIQLGATHTVLFKRDSIIQDIMHLLKRHHTRRVLPLGSPMATHKGTPAMGLPDLASPSGVDYAIEATGNTDAMEASFEIVKNGGCAVLAGNIQKGKSIRLDPYGLINGKRIIGSYGGDTKPDEDFPYYARSYLSGALRINTLITKTYTLKEVNLALAAMAENTIIGRAVIDLQV